MVVMESVCPIPAGETSQQQHHHHRAWYDPSSSLQQQQQQSTSAADELADAYFKGQNYFSQVQGAYQGMHG
jgi:hypothetical protein